MAIEEARPASRRNVLLGGLAAAAGLAATRLGTPDEVTAAANGNVQLATGVGNTDNDAATETRVNVTGDGATAFSAVQSQSGTGLAGSVGANGIGVDGRNTNTGDPELDPTVSTHRSGVFGVAGSPGTEGDVGGIAANTDQTGVYGFSDMTPYAAGVWGDSWQGSGVVGTGDYGVYAAGDSVGVYAATTGSPSAYALYTSGRIRFDGRSGHASITTGRLYKDVPIAGMTAGSDVIVTLRTYRAGFIVAAAVPSAGKFRLYLNKRATRTFYFSYLVIG
jgi:hypothetical protein